MPRLELQDIRHSFNGAFAVNGLSLEVEAGELVCLLGPSGCGKTTTLRVAAGLERQDSGAVRVDDRTVSEGPLHHPPETRSVGLMFQEFALFPHLTVIENVAFGFRRGEGRRCRGVSAAGRDGGACRKASAPAIERRAATGGLGPRPGPAPEGAVDG